MRRKLVPAFGHPNHYSDDVNRTRMTASCLDLDKLPAGFRQDAIHGLALGAPLMSRAWGEYRYDRTATGEYVYGFNEEMKDRYLGAIVLTFLGFLSFVTAGERFFVIAAWILTAALALAATITGIGVARWFSDSVRFVSIQEHIIATANGENLEDADAETILNARRYLDGLVSETPKVLTEDIWLSAYQIQADIAVARNLDDLPEANAKARAKFMRERAKESLAALEKLHRINVGLPTKRRTDAATKKAQYDAGLAELVKQNATRLALSSQLGEEPLGNFIDIAAIEGTEPEGNYTEIPATAPAYLTYPGVPTSPTPGKRGRMGRRAG